MQGLLRQGLLSANCRYSLQSALAITNLAIAIPAIANRVQSI